MDVWYFSDVSRRLRHDDGRKIELGVTHTVEGPPVLCEHGLHGSARAIDALRYAPGPIVWRARLGGQVVKGSDKAAATERTYIAGGVDVSHTLRAFARSCALDVIDLWDAPDVVRQYLETGDETLRDAAWAASRDASGAASRDASRDAAWNAARDASGAAAWAAARDASGAAAWAAAWNAAWDAAWNAAWNAAKGAAWNATRDAAWHAAGAAARAEQAGLLERMLTDAIRRAPAATGAEEADQC